MINFCGECHKIIYSKLVIIRKGGNEVGICRTCYMKSLAGLPEIYIAWTNKLKKVCKSCNHLLPATERFYKRDIKGKHQLSDVCLECQRIKSCEHQHKRRTLVNSAVKDYKPYYWLMAMKHFDGKCAYCGSTENISKDHIVPLSKGGGYTKDNIIPACRSCNTSKSTRTLDEWYPTKEFYSEERNHKIVEWVEKSKRKAV